MFIASMYGMCRLLFLTSILLFASYTSVLAIPLPGEEETVGDNCETTPEGCVFYADTTDGAIYNGTIHDATYPSGCIRIYNEGFIDDRVVLNTHEGGVAERVDVSPTCLLTPKEISAGGDPHFLGFFESFSFMGACDLLLLSVPTHHVQIHIRTTIQSDFSYISGIAAIFGSDIIEVKTNGSVWINKELAFGNSASAENVHHLPRSQIQIKQSFKGKKHNIIVYDIDLQNNLSLEFRANLKNHMLFIGTHGIFPAGTTGLLGSPTMKGLWSRTSGPDEASVNMVGGDTDIYSETWQIRPGEDTKLFMDDREPQFPLTCVYPTGVNINMKDEHITSSKTKLRGRKLLDDVDAYAVGVGKKYKVTMDAAKEACRGISGVKLEFCLEDTMRTGDLNLSLDEFYR